MNLWQRYLNGGGPTLNQVIRQQRGKGERMPNFKAGTWTGSRSFESFNTFIKHVANENRKQINVSSKPFDDEKKKLQKSLEEMKKSKPSPPKKDIKKKPPPKPPASSSFKSKELARRKYKEKNFINR